MNNTFYSKNDYRYYLAHYGVKGMRWGHRKQRTIIGRPRGQRQQMSDSQRKAIRRQRAKRAAIIGGSVVAAGLIAYGGYKLHNKKVLEMANNYASIRYGKDKDYFKTAKQVKNSWYGNKRRMMEDIKSYSDRSLRRQRRAHERSVAKEYKLAAQNAYLTKLSDIYADKHTGSIR